MSTGKMTSSIFNRFLQMMGQNLRYGFLYPIRHEPGLHIIVTIAEHASDVAPKRVLRLSIHRLQIFLVKYGYLQSLQPCEDQGIHEKLKKTCWQPCACDPYDFHGDQTIVC